MTQLAAAWPWEKIEELDFLATLWCRGPSSAQEDCEISAANWSTRSRSAKAAINAVKRLFDRWSWWIIVAN